MPDHRVEYLSPTEPQLVPSRPATPPPSQPPPTPPPPSPPPPTPPLPPPQPPPPVYPTCSCGPAADVLRFACALLSPQPPPAPLSPTPTAAQNLQSRFPEAPLSRILALLATHGGHAGRAARELAGRWVAPAVEPPAPPPPAVSLDLGTELREVEERIDITQDRIDGGSLTYARAELLELRQQLRDRAAQLQLSIAAHTRALEKPPPPMQLPSSAPAAPPSPRPREPVVASYLYESSAMAQLPASSHPPSSMASSQRNRPPRAHDRRGWRSRAPWRHADGARSRLRRDECRGAGCWDAPCIRIAYGEGMGRSRSGPASILLVVSPARPPTQ